MAALKRWRSAFLCSLLWACLPVLESRAAVAAVSETQVKAVFLFNFSHFVAWPSGTFSSPTQPFVIGVLGGDAVAAQLSEAVRGERVDEHPLQVRRVHSAEELNDCQMLFIDSYEAAQLDRILPALEKSSTLTVSDAAGASRRGVMIQFATEKQRIRLLINVESARAAGLTISSNLLRPAEIVRTEN